MKLFAVLAAALLVALPAAGQSDEMSDAIVAYNEAVSSGGAAARVDAARALGQATLRHPEREDAGLLAYEAGQTLCVYAACDGAIPFAEFASSRPLAGDAVYPSDVALLKAYSAWKDKSDRSTRNLLDQALEDVGDEGLTSLSLTAHHNRYIADFKDQNWRQASQTAAQAASHFAPFRSVIGEQWSDASIASIVAGFNSRPDTKDVMDMAYHRLELEKIRYMTETKPDWLNSHRYLAEAWQMAMSAYFAPGVGPRIGSRIEGPDPQDLNRRVKEIMGRALEFKQERPEVASDVEEEDESRLPPCDGTFDMTPPLRYSAVAAQKRMYGAVIARIKVEDREVADVEILAAVPSSSFEEDAEETIRKWEWIPEGETVGVTCDPSYRTIIQPMTFVIR